MNTKTKNEIINLFPQLTKEKSLIINFISLDGATDVYFQIYLYSIYPDLENKIKDLIYQNKLTQKNIYPYSKTDFNNIIVNVPYKEEYSNEPNIDMIKENLKKIKILIEKYRFNNIIISKEQISKSLFNKINNNFTYI